MCIHLMAISRCLKAPRERTDGSGHALLPVGARRRDQCGMNLGGEGEREWGGVVGRSTNRLERGTYAREANRCVQLGA